MKLGISYLVFDGEELLETAIKNIRNEVDFVSVVYQNISFFGNPASESLLTELQSIKEIDSIQCFENDLSVDSKVNETALRNLGIRLSRDAGCTHHISADVDEFYLPDQLTYAKRESEGYDGSVVYVENYFKYPTFQIYPSQNHRASLIHKIDAVYDPKTKFPVPIEVSRRFAPCDNVRFFSKEEFIMHHMSFIRKDIRKKIENSPSKRFYNVDKFVNLFSTYRVGEKIKVAPDFISRKTKLVNNTWGEKWQQVLLRESGKESADSPPPKS